MRSEGRKCARLEGAGCRFSALLVFQQLLFFREQFDHSFGSDGRWWLASVGTTEFAEEGVQILATLANKSVEHCGKQRFSECTHSAATVDERPEQKTETIRIITGSNVMGRSI